MEGVIDRAMADERETRYLRLLERDGWSYVERPNLSGVVTIVAVTNAGDLLFVEQHRPPVAASTIELPAGLDKFISLFELSKNYDATILRDRQIVILVSGEGKVLPAPAGFYVFPDGIIAETGKGGLIGALWGEEFSTGGAVWSMCQPEPGVWVEC